ncbi:MAG TPA: glycosyltransferase family 4 protein [Arenibaculum sp.]|nr:glycosyltransferase family 4 protein [Arenibaculum sp.]
MTSGPIPLALGVGAAALAFSWAATWFVLGQLRRRAILDLPNERSSHSVPTPRGGGWGIMMVLAPALVLAGWSTGGWSWALPILCGTALLVAVSWADDRNDVPAFWRLAAQAGAVVAGLAALPADAQVVQGILPWWADCLGAAFAWIWFVNLFNFMDGIDGLAGSEAACVGAGLCIVAALAPAAPPALWLGSAVAGAAAGFLPWNWQPARVFMGDVGSIPLGYLLGWLLLLVAGAGFWEAALLLPLYFLADATLTLLKRVLAGKRVWQAHREHFYQRAVHNGRSHAAVVRLVLAVNALLAAFAVASVEVGWLAVPPGLAAVAALLVVLSRRPTPCRRTRA